MLRSFVCLGLTQPGSYAQWEESLTLQTTPQEMRPRISARSIPSRRVAALRELGGGSRRASSMVIAGRRGRGRLPDGSTPDAFACLYQDRACPSAHLAACHFRGATRHSCSIPLQRVWNGVRNGVWNAMACRRAPTGEVVHPAFGTWSCNPSITWEVYPIPCCYIVFRASFGRSW